MSAVLAALGRKLSSAGVIDGLWTVTASFGSKLQTLALLALVTRQHGLEGVGVAILVTSTAILIASIGDLGLSSQVVRGYAQARIFHKRTIIRPLLHRVMWLAPLTAIVVIFMISGALGGQDVWAWTGITFCYAVAYQGSSIVTQLAYGAGRFKSAAALNGTVRSMSVVALLLLALVDAPLTVFILSIAVFEGALAVIQYTLVKLPHSDGLDSSESLSLRRTWRFGVGSIANTIMNRSDAVVVSLVASAGVIGVYGLSSQIENALTTVALIPAGAVVAYTARANSHAEAKAIGSLTGWVVAGCYCVIALPFLFFTQDAVHLAFGASILDPLPFQICIVAGIFSCLGGVSMQQLTGKGHASLVATIWVCVALSALCLLLLGALIWGAVGAALGALLRDVVFWAVTGLALRRTRMRDEIQERIVEFS